ncbi:hypothetical protein AK812_SmicGene36234 [Symbiodinium microadriaticum]|uniref:Ion transport domain-containing protein n=1 Tax=Symbiodinium microadriaticum TaxID=2951 RepID=A0A1Q9CJG8_SYMMI|nr:hypothetical protein AK812_SmicGene36234 [Symbiodinium microadriaticum]
MADQDVKLVMQQIEQLIQGLLSAHDRDNSSSVIFGPGALCKTGSRKQSLNSLVSRSVEAPSPGNVAAPQTNPKRIQIESSLPSRQVSPSDDDDGSDPVEENSGFRLDLLWSKRHQELTAYRRNKSALQTQSTTLFYFEHEVRESRWISFAKQLWSFMASAFLLFDCISVPLLAFSVREPWWCHAIRLVFWMLSLPRIWLMHGRYVTSIVNILVEVVLLIMLLCTVVFGTSLSSDVLFILRGSELLRLRFLAKLDSFSGIPRRFIKWSRGELWRLEARAAGNIFYAMVACLIGLHWLTCLWFVSGMAPNGWVFTEIEADLLDQPVVDRYRIALEWAVSRIPPSKTTDNVLLASQADRGIALSATAMALLAASIFTSIVTNDLSDIRRAQRQQGEADSQLADFLETFPVSWTLERQLKAYLRQTVQKVSLPSKRDMAALLPDLLHGQLCSEALGAIIYRHQMLTVLMTKYPSFQRDLCVKGLEDWTAAPNEALFSPGLPCHSMLFVAFDFVLYRRRGAVTAAERSNPLSAKTYTLPRGSSWGSIMQTPVPAPKKTVLDTEPSLRVKRCHWLCEPCLWTDWHYHGHAVAGSCASLLCLSPASLLSITSGHAEISAELVIHARLFLNALNEIPEEDLSDVQHVL